MTLFYIILSTFILSLIAFSGLIVLVFKESLLKKLILPLVAFSAGALLGGALLHLIPEALEKSTDYTVVLFFVIIGFSAFLLLEQFIHWHHCHKPPSEHKSPVTYLILIADTVHNFIDGLAIGGAFIADIKLGFVTWFAIASHEIPQELGDFGILLHGGWKKKKALLFNFISGLSAILGGIVAYFFFSKLNIFWVLSFAAGSFIYISSSDLIPEIKHKESLKENLVHFFLFILGVLMIWAVKLFE